MSVQFETPENVTIEYEPAGLGSRFLAVALDFLFLLIPYVLILLAIIGIYLQGNVLLEKTSDKLREHGMVEYVALVGMILMTLWGVLSVAYFAVFELLMHGQTPGKKIMGLRVVKTGGFSLDAASIILRSVFRVLDNFPPLWVVPFFSSLKQRVGDYAAKTIVVFDTPPGSEMQDLKEKLLSREAGTPRFAFNAVLTKKMPWEAVLAAEKLLLRWPAMSLVHKERFVRDFCNRLAAEHKIPEPDVDSAQLFLEEFLTQRYRQQYRMLG